MIDIYAVAVIVLLMLIVAFVILTPEEKIDRWKHKITAFSSLAILATIMIFLLNYLSNEKDRERQIKLDVIEILDERINNLEKMFLERKELEPLYKNLYMSEVITQDEWNKPEIQHMLSIILRNIDDYVNLVENYTIDTGINNLIKKWFMSNAVKQYYNENKQYYSKGFENYVNKMKLI